MNIDERIHIATGVWYMLSFTHSRYARRFYDEYERFHNSCHRYISAMENCEPITKDEWGADYDTLNGSAVRPAKELIDLTKEVCAEFFSIADCGERVKLPMIRINMERLVNGATHYKGKNGRLSVDNAGEYENDCYSFICNRLGYTITPLNISDALKQKIERIHVVKNYGVSWNQESKLNPDTSLRVICCDKNDAYVKEIGKDTDVVDTNLHLIQPSKTGHIPSGMADLFKRKTAPIISATQTKLSR